jgi:hypothetical protein
MIEQMLIGLNSCTASGYTVKCPSLPYNMYTTVATLPNGSRVFVLEQVLEADTLAHAHKLSSTFSTDNPLWRRAGTADNYPRWEYCVDHVSFEPIRQAFSCHEHLSKWQQHLAPDSTRKLFCSNITFFIDLPGTPPLLPHVEGVDSWLSQVYIAREPHAYNGTTIYNHHKQVLFQLPYRDNMGWLFDTAGQVMHGREHSVPVGLDRFSLMIWYALLPN